MTIGQRIKAERERQGLTIKELAKKASMNAGKIYNYEEEISNPDWNTAEWLFNAMGLTIELKQEAI